MSTMNTDLESAIDRAIKRRRAADAGASAPSEFESRVSDSIARVRRQKIGYVAGGPGGIPGAKEGAAPVQAPDPWAFGAPDFTPPTSELDPQTIRSMLEFKQQVKAMGGNIDGKSDAEVMALMQSYAQNAGNTIGAHNEQTTAIDEFSRGLRRGVAYGLPAGLDFVREMRENEQVQRAPEGMAGFAGETLGGFAGLLDPGKAPQNAAAIWLTGGLGKIAQPVIGRIASVAGNRVANAVSEAILNAGQGGGMAALEEAGKIPVEEWQRDWQGSLARVGKAAGVGAVAAGGLGAAFGTMRAETPPQYAPTLPERVAPDAGAPIAEQRQINLAQQAAADAARTIVEGQTAMRDVAQAFNQGPRIVDPNAPDSAIIPGEGGWQGDPLARQTFQQINETRSPEATLAAAREAEIRAQEQARASAAAIQAQEQEATQAQAIQQIVASGRSEDALGALLARDAEIAPVRGRETPAAPRTSGAIAPAEPSPLPPVESMTRDALAAEARTRGVLPKGAPKKSDLAPLVQQARDRFERERIARRAAMEAEAQLRGEQIQSASDQAAASTENPLAELLARRNTTPDTAREATPNAPTKEFTNGQEGQGSQEGLLSPGKRASSKTGPSGIASQAVDSISYDELVRRAKAAGVYRDGPKTRAALVERVSAAETRSAQGTPTPESPESASARMGNGAAPAKETPSVATSQPSRPATADVGSGSSVQRSASPNPTRQPWEMTKADVDALTYDEFLEADRKMGKVYGDLYWRLKNENVDPADVELHKRIIAATDLFHDRSEAFDAERKARQEVASKKISNGEPWSVTRAAFVSHHKTGSISESAYEKYATREGVSFLGKPEKYPEVVGGRDGIEYRTGNAKDTIVAFDKEGPIGWVSNEFGVPGVFVISDYQRRGVGTELLDLWMSAKPPNQKIGQMTGSGQSMAGAYHKRLVTRALSEGRPVPPEVLKDYPDLAKSVKPPTPAEPATTAEGTGAAQAESPRASGESTALEFGNNPNSDKNQYELRRDDRGPYSRSLTGWVLLNKKVKSGEGFTTVRTDIPESALEIAYDTPHTMTDTGYTMKENKILSLMRKTEGQRQDILRRVLAARTSKDKTPVWSDSDGNIQTGEGSYRNRGTKLWEPLNEAARAAKVRIDRQKSASPGRVDTPKDVRGRDIYVYARSNSGQVKPMAGPFYTQHEAEAATREIRNRIDKGFSGVSVIRDFAGFSYGAVDRGSPVDVLYPDIRSPEGSSPFTDYPGTGQGGGDWTKPDDDIPFERKGPGGGAYSWKGGESTTAPAASKWTQTTLQPPPKAPRKATLAEVPIPTVELVKLSKMLLGRVPKLTAGGKPWWGVFRSSDGGSAYVEVTTQTAKDPVQLAKTLAHELGHAMDWMPNKTLARGNVLSRTRSESPVFRHIGEMNSAMKQIEAQSLSEGGPTHKALKDELKALTQWWKPFDEKADPEFTRYRYSAKELYADTVSVLLNDPRELKRRAPTFYRQFEKFIDRKPAVRDSLLTLQDLLGGTPEKLASARRADIREWFGKGEEIMRARAAEREMTKDPIMAIRQALYDTAAPLVAKEARAKRAGIKIADEHSAALAMDSLNMADNEVHVALTRYEREAATPMRKAGVSENDLGEFMFLRRVTADRAELANPGGYTPETARQQIESLRKMLGPEKWKALNDAAGVVDDLFYSESERAARNGLYSREVLDSKIEPNKGNYATFAVLNYLDDRIGAGVVQMDGTFNEIANPLTATMMKLSSLIRANVTQETKTRVFGMLRSAFPEDFHYHPPQPHAPGTRAPTPKLIHKGRELVPFMVDGKMAHMEVDPYTAAAFQRAPNEVAQVVKRVVGDPFYKFMHPLYVTFNPGWQAMNLPRDLNRTWKNLNAIADGAKKSSISVRELLSEYVKAVPSAWKRARGDFDPKIEAMLADKSLGIPYSKAVGLDDSALGRMEKRYNVDAVRASEQERNIAVKAAHAVFSLIEDIGNTIETLPKIAGHEILGRRGLSGERLAYAVRNYAGTPNTTRRGNLTTVTNSVLSYANVMLQGYRADAAIALGRDPVLPSSRSAWWTRSILTDLGPKMLMGAGAAGLLGTEVKEIYDLIPESDLAGYVCIPLGTTEDRNGVKKAVYLRIPHLDTLRPLMAATWMLSKGRPQDSFSQVRAALPSWNPMLESVTNWSQYAAGINPREEFRGRDIIGSDAFKAGGKAALIDMAKWQADQFGVLTQLQRAVVPSRGETGEKTWLETALSVPGIGSVLKVSNRGASEKDWASVDAENAQDAAFRLSLPDNVTQARRELSRLERLGKERLDRTELNRMSRLKVWRSSVYERLTDRMKKSTSEQERDALRKSLEGRTEELAR